MNELDEELMRIFANPSKFKDADDWTKARAFEDLILLATGIVTRPVNTPGEEVAKEVGGAFLRLAIMAIDKPIAREESVRAS